MNLFYHLNELDTQLLFWINGLRNPLFDWVMPIITNVGSLIPFALIFIAWRLFKGNNRERLFWILGIMAILFGDAICTRLLKPLFARHRPYDVLDNLYLFKKETWLITTEKIRATLKIKYSMPSCHAINTWTAASYLFLSYKKGGILVTILAFLVSYSRIYLGVHYPSDVLLGAVLGIINGFWFHFIFQKGFRRYFKLAR